jgi:hypothetical protein
MYDDISLHVYITHPCYKNFPITANVLINFTIGYVYIQRHLFLKCNSTEFFNLFLVLEAQIYYNSWYEFTENP